MSDVAMRSMVGNIDICMLTSRVYDMYSGWRLGSKGHLLKRKKRKRKMEINIKYTVKRKRKSDASECWPGCCCCRIQVRWCRSRWRTEWIRRRSARWRNRRRSPGRRTRPPTRRKPDTKHKNSSLPSHASDPDFAFASMLIRILALLSNQKFSGSFLLSF